MERRNILSLLGLCLRGGHLAVGEEPAEDDEPIIVDDEEETVPPEETAAAPADAE